MKKIYFRGVQTKFKKFFKESTFIFRAHTWKGHKDRDETGLPGSKGER